MTRGQVIKKLRREGYRATVGRVRWALRTGQVQPLPIRAARGAYDFQPMHLRQLRAYFVRVRPGPRPIIPEKFPITGPADRLHRLDRKEQSLQDRRLSRQALRQRRRAADDAIRSLELIARELGSECAEGGIPGSGAAQ